MFVGAFTRRIRTMQMHRDVTTTVVDLSHCHGQAQQVTRKEVYPGANKTPIAIRFMLTWSCERGLL